MKKRILTLAIALIIILSIFAIPAYASSNLSATPTASTVYVNGTATAFEAYNIGGNNYFKLRDLAYALNGTAKQFEVGYDNNTKAITLTTGQAYTPDGGEMARGDGTAKTASPTASRIYLNGMELNLTVYLIGGNNFFKLRDLMEAIDVFVGYDSATKAITLDTSKGYEPEASATPTPAPTPSGGNIDPQQLVGVWGPSPHFNYTFYSDGTFLFDRDPRFTSIFGGESSGSLGFQIKGNWRLSGNTLNMTNRMYRSNSLANMTYSEWAPHSSGDETLSLTFGFDYHVGGYVYPDYFIESSSEAKYHKMQPYWLENTDNAVESISYAPINRSWTGTWDTDFRTWGLIQLTQNGENVSGTFESDSSRGTISGTISGSELFVKRTDSNGSVDDYKFELTYYGMSFEVYFWYVDHWIPSTTAWLQ